MFIVSLKRIVECQAGRKLDVPVECLDARVLVLRRESVPLSHYVESPVSVSVGYGNAGVEIHVDFTIAALCSVEVRINITYPAFFIFRVHQSLVCSFL